MKVSDLDIVLFDTVLRYTWNCREQAVNKLFPQFPQKEKDEHMGRTTYAFWNHLGEHDRRRLIQFAIEHYDPSC